MLRRLGERVGVGVPVVDLHEALSRDLFSDPVGHVTAAGSEVLAARVRPVVVRELALGTSASPAP